MDGMDGDGLDGRGWTGMDGMDRDGGNGRGWTGMDGDGQDGPDGGGWAHPIKGGGASVVEDHNKASGLELR